MFARERGQCLKTPLFPGRKLFQSSVNILPLPGKNLRLLLIEVFNLLTQGVNF